MKDGTLYASRLKKAYQKWKHVVPDPSIRDGEEDPIRRLAVAILGTSSNESDAERAVTRLLEQSVDWNEVRVSLPMEMYRLLDEVLPKVRDGGERLIQALQSIYEKEHKISLDRLKSMGRRDARQYLENLKGVDDYAVASVMLWCFGGHAVPVNDAQWQLLKDLNLVHPMATRGEVQAFLERHVSANDAKKFCAVLQGVSGSKRSLLEAGKTSRAKKKSAAK